LSIVKRLLEKDRDSALIYLRDIADGNAPFEPDDLIDGLASKDTTAAFYCLKAILRRKPEVLVSALKSSVHCNGVENLKVNEPVYFSFPAVGNSHSCIVQGIAVPGADNVCSPWLNVKADSVKNLIKEGFLLCFDRKFQGNSFQASLAYSLLFKNVPEGFMLSGKVDEKGNFTADRVKEKEELVRKRGFKLITEGNIFKIHEVLSGENVTVPFVVSTGTPPIRSFCKSANIDIKTLVKVFGLSADAFSLELPAHLPPSNWRRFVNEFSQKVENLKKVVANPFLHVGLRTPASLAFGMGASLGTGKIPVAVYHYENGRYFRVADLSTNSRKIKLRRKHLKLIGVEELTGISSGQAVIAIQIASHETFKRAKLFAENIKADYFYISAKNYKGAIPLDVDWTEVVSEVYSILNSIYDKGYEKMHIVMSVPVAIAFLLGMAVGNYWHVIVYNYFRDSGGYEPVLNVVEVEQAV